MSTQSWVNELPTVGVEEEFLLVDPRTGEPAPRNTEVAAQAESRGVTLQLELSSCQVETTSSVATTTAANDRFDNARIEIRRQIEQSIATGALFRGEFAAAR